MKKIKLKHIIAIIAVLAISATIADFSNYYLQVPEEVPYTEFVEDWENGLVDEVYLTNKDAYTFRYNLKNDEYDNLPLEEKHKVDKKEWEWKYTINPCYDDFIKDLSESGIYVYNTDFTPKSIGLWVLSFIILLYGAVGLLLYRLLINPMGKQPKFLLSENPSVKLDEVIGHEEIIDDIKFLIKFMRDPKIGKSLGAIIPKGILLTGPPGTGKTMIAKAIASEANVPFYSVSGSDFVEMFVGTGARRVRELFKQARNSKPCIIFIDELDAIGIRREENVNTQEYRQTINQLLKEMDGFGSDSGILVIGATNFPDELDKALTRAGRFDRRIEVLPPTKDETRERLFKRYTEGKNIDSTVDFKSLAKQTSGLTGADIHQICNESAIIALSYGLDTITEECLVQAIDKRLTNGNKSKKEPEKFDREITLYHESGHAVIRYLLGLEIIRVTITPYTSGVGGFVLGAEKSTMSTKQDIENEIMVLYAGRCSEEIKFGENQITIGASSDIRKATELLFNYNEVLCFKSGQPLIDYTVIKKSTSNIDTKSMEDLAISLKDKCIKLLKDNYNLVETLVENLREKDTLTGNEVKALLDKVSKNALEISEEK